MDSKSIFLGIGLLVLLVVTFFYYKGRYNKDVNKQLSQFMNIGNVHQLKISLYDLWEPGYAIGLDAEKKKLLYVRTRAQVEEKILVDLADIKSCHVINMHRDLHGSRIIDSVTLQIAFKNNTSQRLNFYNKEENLNLRNELQLAEKWNTIVQDELVRKMEGAIRTS